MSDPLGNKPEDFLNKAMKAGVGALPVVGGALAELFNFVVADPAQERRDDFLRETMARLVDLQAQHDELSAEALRDNEQFQATMLQAARLATATASSEKTKASSKRSSEQRNWNGGRKYSANIPSDDRIDVTASCGATELS
jgi:hypothetical protein